MRAHDMIQALYTTEEGSDEREKLLERHEQHLVGYNVFPPEAEIEDVELVVSVFDDGSIALTTPKLAQSTAVNDPEELHQLLVEDLAQRCDNPDTVAVAVMKALGFIAIAPLNETMH